MMHDCCPKCGIYIAFHRQDLGKPNLQRFTELKYCWNCQYDLSNSPCENVIFFNDEIRLQWQNWLNQIANLDYLSNTIRSRIKNIAPQIKIAKRLSHKAAEMKFSPLQGSFPNADYPLSVVQIDHTKLDIILVDDIYRKPIGRPWITLAIDVFSRMVTGFYVSFDPPSALSTGLCLAHSILSKESWLAKHGVKGRWPVWGLPRKIHLDNAKEFRGKVLEKACKQYGIEIEWRPVARPHFGGHIERLLGTILDEVHGLTGTTFANTQQRKDYASESKAALTLTEFETWLTLFICDVYHQRTHYGLGISPLAKWKSGVLGDDVSLGTGLPDKVVDETLLRLTFMPFEMRTVQQYGVVIHKITYWHDVLRPWIAATNPTNPRQARQFIFRIDPRDLSVIWFYDPVIDVFSNTLSEQFESSYQHLGVTRDSETIKK